MTPKLPLYKVVVIGDGGVGKTALTIQLCSNKFLETYDPTIEDSYRKKVTVNDTHCMLEILDTAGQEEYAALRDQWIRDGQGFMLVYSIVERSTFERIERYYEQVLNVKDIETINDRNRIPMIVVGNKCDKNNEREVSREEGQVLGKRLGCPFIETSAKENKNVEKAFFDVLGQIIGGRKKRSIFHCFLL